MNRQKIIVMSQIISLSIIVGYDSVRLMYFSYLGPQNSVGFREWQVSLRTDKLTLE